MSHWLTHIVPVASSTVRVTAANLVLETLHIFGSKTSHSRTDTKLWDRPVEHDCSLPTCLHVYCSLLPTVCSHTVLWFMASSFCTTSYEADPSNATFCQIIRWVFRSCFCFIFVFLDYHDHIHLFHIRSQGPSRGSWRVSWVPVLKMSIIIKTQDLVSAQMDNNNNINVSH